MKTHIILMLAGWLTLFGCASIEGEGPPLENRLTSDQVALLFFEAYRNGDREAASNIAEPKALNKLIWDGSAKNNPTMSLEGEAIVYEGGAIFMVIHQDGHVGARMVDVLLIVD